MRHAKANFETSYPPTHPTTHLAQAPPKAQKKTVSTGGGACAGHEQRILSWHIPPCHRHMVIAATLSVHCFALLHRSANQISAVPNTALSSPLMAAIKCLLGCLAKLFHGHQLVMNHALRGCPISILPTKQSKATAPRRADWGSNL